MAFFYALNAVLLTPAFRDCTRRSVTAAVQRDAALGPVRLTRRRASAVASATRAYGEQQGLPNVCHVRTNIEVIARNLCSVPDDLLAIRVAFRAVHSSHSILLSTALDIFVVRTTAVVLFDLSSSVVQTL